MTSSGQFFKDIRVLHKVARMLDRLSKRGDRPHEAASDQSEAADTYSPPNVTYTEGDGKWLFEMRFVGKVVHVACYDDEQEGAIAHDDIALELFGEMANLHYPSRLEDPFYPPDDPLSRRISGIPPGC
jgi:hypothetical protein